MGSEDDFAARLMDGRADAPAAMLWWPRHVASLMAHAAAPRARRRSTLSRLAAVAAQWASFVPGRAGSIMAEHVLIEAAAAEAIASGDRAVLARLAERLAENVSELGSSHAEAIEGFPARAFCRLVARHTAMMAEEVRRLAGRGGKFLHGDDVRANTIALARFTAEWAGTAKP